MCFRRHRSAFRDQAAKDAKQRVSLVLDRAFGDERVLEVVSEEQRALQALAELSWLLDVRDPHDAAGYEQRLYKLEVERQKRLALDARRRVEIAQLQGAKTRAEDR